MAENNQNTTSSSQEKKKKNPFSIYWIYILIALGFFGLQFVHFSGGPKEITRQEFENIMLKNHDIEKVVVVNREKAEVHLTEQSLISGKYDNMLNAPQGGKVVEKGPHFYFTIGSVESFEKRLEEVQKSFTEEQKISVRYETRRDITSDIISWVIPILILVIIWVVIFRRMGSGMGGGGNIFNIGKSRAKVFDKEENEIKINFKDVAGLEEAKVEIQEIVEFLKTPQKYTQLGGKIPKGVLLIGPPGTGKTLLAKAVAGEANVAFFSMSGSDFVELFVGVGASRVRDLFAQAKQKSPCIIFIDEIDAIGRARGRNASFSSNDEKESTLNQLLTEMDGFDTSSGIIMLAATNRADMLDSALLRSGRFDRQIHVELPDLNERREIFKVHLRPLTVEQNLDLDFLSRQTSGFSGADIATVCNEAALIAARKNKTIIEKQDFLDAVDRLIAGLERKSKVISPQEKIITAYHEAGHASVSWLLEYAHPLVKVTIVPRGRTLGAAWYLPEERQLSNREQLYDMICSALGGRAAEELHFKTFSTGALNDLERVTKQAYAMMAYLGMSEKIGHRSFYDSSQNEYAFHRPYSEKTAELIDNEVSDLIEKAYLRTFKLLSDNKDKFEQLAELLLEKEVIFNEDVERIFGKRLFTTNIS